MSASFIPSLKHISLARTAVKICKDTEIRCLVNKLDYHSLKFGGVATWEELLEKASLKLPKLYLPDPLRQGVLALIKPIALEISRWKYDHFKILGADFDYSSCQLHWKHEGIIDRRTTAEKLVLNENLLITTRFLLACYYCLQNEVERIWGIMSPTEKGLLLRENFPFSVHFWLSWMERKRSINWSRLAQRILEPRSFLSYLFDLVWLRCFFDKLTPGEKKQCIAYSVKNTFKDHDNFRFGISQLEEHERESVFKENPFEILLFFLDWPYQSMFLEAAEQMWKYLQETDFRYLIHVIIYDRIVEEWYDFDYVNLLKDFWSGSPQHFKEYIKKDAIFGPVKIVLDHDCQQPFPKKKIIPISSCPVAK